MENRRFLNSKQASEIINSKGIKCLTADVSELARNGFLIGAEKDAGGKWQIPESSLYDYLRLRQRKKNIKTISIVTIITIFLASISALADFLQLCDYFPRLCGYPPRSSSTETPPAVVDPNAIDEIMTNALVGEHIYTGASVDTAGILTDPQYAASEKNGYVIWNKPLTEIFTELDLTVQYAISADGHYYVGVIGQPSQTLAVLIGRNEWWPRVLSFRDILLYRVLRQEYLSLENDGHVSGGSGLDGTVEIWNNYDKPIYVLYSALMMWAEVNRGWDLNNRLEQWDPSWPSKDYTGDTWRNLRVSYSGASRSFIYSHCYNDNNNESYVTHDGTLIISCGPFIGGDDHVRINDYPNDIELHANRTWSEFDTSIHIVVTGDALTSSNHKEYPLRNNPAPSILMIPQGISNEEINSPIVNHYTNEFNDLDGWVQGKGLINVRCDEPLLQKDSVVYMFSGNAAGYLQLPSPIISGPNVPFVVEIKFRYNGNGGFAIGFYKRDDFPCKTDSNNGFAFSMNGEGGDKYNLITDEERIMVETIHDANWHIAKLVRDSAGYWSIYVDEELRGRGVNEDKVYNYRFVSIQGYSSLSAIAEIDYLKIYQDE